MSKEWKQRMLIVILATAGLGGWFLFDGLIAYPKSNERSAAYSQLQEKHGEDTPAFEEAWRAAAKENGWVEKKPKPIYEPGEIQTQILLATLTWLGTAACLFNFLRSLPTTTRLDGEILTLPDGRKIDIGTIRAVSKRRWESKSIADLIYEPAPGKPKRFVLDDYKYIGVAKILEQIECTMPEVTKPASDG